MACYVDDMEAPYGQMIMCHMIADTTAELLAMAAAIGVQRKWIQHAGTVDEHFDVALSKKAQAIALGAIPITWRECAAMSARKCKLGYLGSPADAIAWLKEDYRIGAGEEAAPCL